LPVFYVERQCPWRRSRSSGSIWSRTVFRPSPCRWSRLRKGSCAAPPPDPKASLFAGGLGTHILWVSALMATTCLGVGYWFWQLGQPSWQTILFTTLVFAQLAHVLAVRTGRIPLLKAGLLSNPAALGAVLLSMALQLAVIYLPPLQEVFRTVSLTPAQLLLCFFLGSLVFWAVEAEKWFRCPRP